jgi:ligand-binding sensor domain-containing protein
MFVRSVVKDKEGSIWIGTNKGVAVIYNPGNVFSGGNFDAQKIIIQQDGYNQYLLETENVTSIAVDGANRKWFGTYSGGVFLMSPDGTKQILNFNMNNSPLLSNSVMSIAIDDLTGEVFFATDKGIISYRGDATEATAECNNYYVFPNPVRHEYNGPIAIRGLVENADVKISDVAGNVVYHTKANGGEAIWHGKNFKGERAQTGVYLVYVTNEDGSQTCITKMLFAN